MDAETKQGLKAPPARPSTITEHTPGPWHLRQAMKYGPGSTRDKVNWIPDLGRFDVDGPDGDMPSIASDVWEPDAKLIATAPALAEALEMILAVECKGRCALDTGHSIELHELARRTLRAAGRLADEPGTAPKAPTGPTPSPKASP